MPTPTFHADIAPSSIDLKTITFKWYLTVGFTQHNRTDSHRVPASGTANISGTDDWSPQWGGLFAGGNVHVYVTASIGSVNAHDDKGGYQIKGINPQKATVKSGCSINEQVVIYKESSPKWCQFDSSPGWPIFGAPNGWGLMQLDPPGTESDMWNWQENRSDGCAILASKYSEGLNWPKKNREVYKYTQARDWVSAEEAWKDGYQLYNGQHAWVWVLDDPNDKSGPGSWQPNPNCSGYGIAAWNIQQNVANGNPPSGW
jgi:hypothetical protein